MKLTEVVCKRLADLHDAMVMGIGMVMVMVMGIEM